jgi:DNA-binding response OmpR family regulator
LAEKLPVRSALLVDAEPEFLNQARHLLERGGFVVSTAESGTAALNVIELEHPQVVITEVSLPDRKGVDFLMAMRATYPETPVIMVTANADLGEARDAVRQGAFDYIQKPLAADDLLMTCRRAVETFRLRMENRILKQPTSGALTGVPQTARSSSRPERAAMERAALARVTRFMGEAISTASTRVLEQALGEHASDVALTDVLSEVLVKEAAGGEWAAALLRGAQVQRDLLRQAGGTLSASDVGSLLGIGRAAVDKRRRQKALLGLRMPSGDFVYPTAQFAKSNVLPGLPDVLGAFRIQDPWMQLDILLARDEALGGRTAFETLAAGDVERVKTIVSSFGEQGL